jgi:hypothetical protein
VNVTYVFVDLVTPTPSYYPPISPPTATLTPISTFYTTSAVDTITPTNTPIYPPLRIIGWKIVDSYCKNGKINRIKVQLILEGGLLPYRYNDDK